MKRGLIALMLLAAVGAHAGTVKTVTAEGSCSVADMPGDQAYFTAVQRARSAAVEKAAGVKVSSSALVTDGSLAVDFIRSFSAGFIVKEHIEALPFSAVIGENGVEVPVYSVRLTADVFLPDRRLAVFGLSAEANRKRYRSGEEAVLQISARPGVHVAVFNIRADDRVAMLLPSRGERTAPVPQSGSMLFPAPESSYSLVMGTLAGHTEDAEGFLVAVSERADFAALFPADELMTLSGFYSRYSRIAEHCEDVLIPYLVVE